MQPRKRPGFPRDPAPDAWQSPRVTANEAIALLDAFLAGGTTRDDVLRAFQAAPMVDLGYARVDVHRSLRKGFPEVIYAEGKTPAQVAGIAAQLGEREKRFLATRVNADHVRALRRKMKGIVHHEQARCVTFERVPIPKRPGFIAVLAAGTSDLPVAEEAAVTADIMGNRVERIYDVGVAGLHRLLSRLDFIQQANVIIAVAGMEGALPGVVTGLVARPVIAVPTSIGYGTNLRGLTALFGMLSSCSSGMTVVNIDNGFGAGYAASQMNALAAGAVEQTASAARNRTTRKPRAARK